MAAAEGPEDQVLEALDRLLAALDRNGRRAEAIVARAAGLRQALEAGAPLPEAVRNEDRPLIVELITEIMRDLQRCGVELRRTEARALRQHGLTTGEIAKLFGVTRQRVSALLRALPASAAQDGRAAS